MRRWFVVIAVVLGLALTAGAVAHNFSASPVLRIAKVPRGATDPGARVVIFGRILSSRSFCKSNRIVSLYRVRPGPDRLMGRDRTDAEGEYRFVRRPIRDHVVYTRIARRFHSSYGHRHVCSSDRSGSLFINVRR
jgi:hypothetical protein